jgi:hypothetical protein
MDVQKKSKYLPLSRVNKANGDPLAARVILALLEAQDAMGWMAPPEHPEPPEMTEAL